LKSIRRAIIDRGTAGLLQYLADKYNEEVDGTIEEWAVRKKGKSKNKKVKYEDEEKKKGPPAPTPQYSHKGDSQVAGRQIKGEHISGFGDHGTSTSNDKKTDDPHSSRGFGSSSAHMFEDVGKGQQDDFFWKGHQQRVVGKDHESHEQDQPMKKAPQAAVEEDVKSTASSTNKKAMIQEMKTLDEGIRELIDDIDNNFGLSKRDLVARRKDLHKLQARRNKLNNELAE